LETTYERSKRETTSLLNNLYLFPTVINHLIILYWETVFEQFETQPFSTWPLPRNGRPYGLASDNIHLYVCDHINDALFSLNLNDGNILSDQMLPIPIAMDIFEQQLYVINKKNVSIMQLPSLELKNTWALPIESVIDRGIKVDSDSIYLTIASNSQIHVYSHSGEPKKRFGSSYMGHLPGQFDDPRGLTIIENLLYICDWGNHRIQVLDKENGDFQFKWGKLGTNSGLFDYPYSIHYNSSILFIGDRVSIQLFDEKGVFFQRIGDSEGEGKVDHVRGVWLVNEIMYVSDYQHCLIKLFRPKEKLIN